MTGNPKVQAWDSLGEAFWTNGKASARPSAAETAIFLAGIRPGARCAIIGASSRFLAEAAARLDGVALTVFDFSPRMCADLAHALDDGRIDVQVLDITGKIPPQHRSRFDVIVNDRLINRFTEAEALRALGGLRDLAAAGGEIRMSIKLGLYPMDVNMIAIGRRRGCLADFFDEATQTMDFSRAGDVLVEGLLPHGNIETEKLLNWYRHRAAEKRYSDEDVRRLVRAASSPARRLALRSAVDFPDASATKSYVVDVVEA